MADLDQFYTPIAVAQECWNYLHQRCAIPANAHYVEPSVGAGAFYNLMPPDRRTGYELAPSPFPAVKQGDFLAVQPLTDMFPEHTIVVGNPPYGARGRLAIAFVSHAFALGADIVAMIVPAALRRHRNGKPPTAERRVQGGYSIDQLDISDDRFILPDGDRKQIQGCAFVIYKKGERPASHAAPAPTCNSYIQLFGICDHKNTKIGLDKIDRCHLFLPYKAFSNDAMVMKTAFGKGHTMHAIGIQILRDHDRVREFLMTRNWLDYTTPKGSLGMPSMNKQCVIDAMIDGGFVDKAGDPHVQVFACRKYGDGTGMQHVPYCDLFLPNSLHHGQRGRMRPYPDFCMGAMFGVKILRDRQRVLDAVMGIPWLKIARVSSNGNVSLGVATITAAIERELAAPPPSPVRLHSIQQKGSGENHGLHHIPRCWMFLPYKAQTASHCRLFPDFGKHTNNAIGIEIPRSGDSCDTFVQLRAIRDPEKQRASWEGADCFFYCSYRVSKATLRDKPPILPLLERPPAMAFTAVFIHRDKERIMQHLRSTNWWNYLRTTTGSGRVLNLLLGSIKQAVIDGGFIDDRAADRIEQHLRSVDWTQYAGRSARGAYNCNFGVVHAALDDLT